MAKDIASVYEPLELKYFTSLCKVLVKNKFINTTEATTRVNSKISVNDHFIKVDVPEGWSVARVQSLIRRLEDDKWLQRDDRGRIELGLRTYLELSIYIQDLITLLEEEEPEDDEEDDINDDEENDENESSHVNKKVKKSSSTLRMKATDLPQLIIY